MLSARDESYSLFHSVGKVLFSKAGADADLIIDRCAADVSTLLAFVHSRFTHQLTADSDMERTADVAHTFALADDIAQAQQSAAMGDVTTQHNTTPSIGTTPHSAHARPMNICTLTMHSMEYGLTDVRSCCGRCLVVCC